MRHYLKHYHYPGELDDDGEGDEGKEKESVVKRATEEAFGNWQVGYNISLVMTYGECTIPDAMFCLVIGAPSIDGTSVVRGAGMEDLPPANGLDCWRYDSPTCLGLGK